MVSGTRSGAESGARLTKNTPSAKRSDKTAGDLQREARLADAARPNERDQPVPGDPLQHLGYLLLAPDERRDLRREVMCNLHRGTVRRAAPASVAVADQPLVPARAAALVRLLARACCKAAWRTTLTVPTLSTSDCADLPVREAFGHQHEDLLLALAQGLQQGL